MEGALLCLEHVSLYYHTPQGETEAIRDLSFELQKGEFVAVVGPSGCGKTTMLSLIMGLNPPSAGQVRFPLGPCPMGYMLQRDNLLEWRTLEKNAVLGLEVRHKLTGETRAKTVALLQKYGLGGVFILSARTALRRHAAEGGPDPDPRFRPGAAAPRRAILGPGLPDPADPGR